ncbi:hypothetical protein Tco_1437528 [Tanacetum coccineum]
MTVMMDEDDDDDEARQLDQTWIDPDSEHSDNPHMTFHIADEEHVSEWRDTALTLHSQCYETAQGIEGLCTKPDLEVTAFYLLKPLSLRHGNPDMVRDDRGGRKDIITAFEVSTTDQEDLSKSGKLHPSETMVFHNEDGNPARANIKQALGSFKDGDGDGDTQPHKGVKASANSDVMYSFSSAQDGDPLQDDVRLCLGDDLKKAQDHSQRQAGDLP